MAVNAVPPAAGPVAAPASPDARRTGEDATQDPTFASLLAAIIAPTVPVPLLTPDPALAGADGEATPTAAVELQGAAAPTMLIMPQGEAAAEAPAPGFGAALLAAQATAATQTGESPAAEAQVAQPPVVPVPPQLDVEPVALAAGSVALAAEPAAIALQAQVVPEGTPAPVAAAEMRRQPALTNLSAPAGEQPELPADAPAVAPTDRTTGPVMVKAMAEAGTELQSETRPQPQARSIRQPAVSLHPAAAPTSTLPMENRSVAELERIPTPIEPARLMEAIAQSLSTARPGRYTVTLQLYPESLGEVRLQVQVVGREVHTIMEVTNPAAKQVLEERGEQLRQTLGQAGLTLSGFTVNTGAGRQSQEQRREQLDGIIAARGRTGRVAVTAGRSGVQPRLSITERTGGRLDTLA